MKNEDTNKNEALKKEVKEQIKVVTKKVGDSIKETDIQEEEKKMKLDQENKKIAFKEIVQVGENTYLTPRYRNSDFSMAKRSLTEEEYLQALFVSSDEEEPSTLAFEADNVRDDLHDALTWRQEEDEAQRVAAEPEEELADEMQDLAVSHAVHLHSLAPRPSSAGPAPPSPSPVSSAVSPVPPAPSPVPPSASPAVTAAVPVPALSPVELRSRKRRRGPLHPTGVALKSLPDDSYKAKDNTKWHSEPNSTMPPIMKIVILQFCSNQQCFYINQLRNSSTFKKTLVINVI
ncbi:uncharacterized protein LOC143034644 [Oratosquilla oratoria]|uniref:uncharacterized protein LOC143034644 n=1 Tax=Oratosquilla oratoria TaxID=337810 RepID=UPI003F767226